MLRRRISAARIAHLNRCYLLRCPSRLNRSGLSSAPACGRSLHASPSQLQQWNPQQNYYDPQVTNAQTPNSNETAGIGSQDEQQQQLLQQQQPWKQARHSGKWQDKPIHIIDQETSGTTYSQQPVYPHIEPSRYVPFANRVPSKSGLSSSSILYPQAKVSPVPNVAESIDAEASQEVDSSVHDHTTAAVDPEASELTTSPSELPEIEGKSSEHGSGTQKQSPTKQQQQQLQEPKYQQQPQQPYIQPQQQQQQQQPGPYQPQQTQQNWYYQGPPNYYPPQQYGYYPQHGGYYPQQPGGYYPQAPPAGYYQPPPPPYGYYPQQPYNYYPQQQQQGWVDPNVASNESHVPQQTGTSLHPSSGSVGGSTTVEKGQEKTNASPSNTLDTAETHSGNVQEMVQNQMPSDLNSATDQSSKSAEAPSVTTPQETSSTASVEPTSLTGEEQNQSRTTQESADDIPNTPTETSQATNQGNASSSSSSNNSTGLGQQKATLNPPQASSQPSPSASIDLGGQPWSPTTASPWNTSSVSQIPVHHTVVSNSNEAQNQDQNEQYGSVGQHILNTPQDISATPSSQTSQPWTPHDTAGWNTSSIDQATVTPTSSEERPVQEPADFETSNGKHEGQEVAEEPVSTGEAPPEELTTAETAAPELETSEDHTTSILDAAYPGETAKTAAEEDDATLMLDQMFPEQPTQSPKVAPEDDDTSAMLDQMFPEESTISQQPSSEDNASATLDQMFPEETATKETYQQEVHISNTQDVSPQDSADVDDISSMLDYSFPSEAPAAPKSQETQPAEAPSWAKTGAHQGAQSQGYDSNVQDQHQGMPLDTQQSSSQQPYPGDSSGLQASWNESSTPEVWQTSQSSPSWQTSTQPTPPSPSIPSAPRQSQQQFTNQANSIPESIATTTEPSEAQKPLPKSSQTHVDTSVPPPPTPPPSSTTPTPVPPASFAESHVPQKPLQPPPFPPSATTQSSLPHSVKKDPTMKTSYSNPKYAKAARRLLELANKQFKDTSPVFKQAKSMAREGFAPTVEMYSVLIGSLAKQEDRVVYQHVALGLLDEMQAEGLQPNSAIYHSLLKILAVSPDFLTRERILEEMRLKFIPLTQEGVESVIFGLLTDGQLERALEIFESRKANQDPISMTVYLETIKALGRAYEIDEALRIGREAIEDLPSQKTTMVWYELLTVAANSLHLEGTTWVWESAVRKGIFNPDDGVCLKVLNTAARHGAPQLAAEVLRILADRGVTLDESHYNSLITAFARGNNVPMAFRTISKIRDAGLSPSPTTSSSIADALVTNGKIDDVDTAYFALKDMHNEGADGGVDVIAFNSIIEACVRLGELERALGVYNDAVSLNVYPNTDTFNSLLFGCVGQWADRLWPLDETIDSESQPPPPQKELALYLAGEMKAATTTPDMRTYELLLQACLYQDEYDDAFTYLEEMKSMHETIGPVRVSVYRWLGWKLLHAIDERINLLLEEMVEVGYGQDANSIGGLLHEKRMKAAQQGQEE